MGQREEHLKTLEADLLRDKIFQEKPFNDTYLTAFVLTDRQSLGDKCCKRDGIHMT